MKVPSCFYGTKSETRKECKKILRKLLKGISLADAVAEYELLDTKEIHEGLFVLDNGLAFKNSYNHFFFSWLIYEIKLNRPMSEETYREDMDRIFYQLIEHDWSILQLSQRSGPFWYAATWQYDGRHRWQPYLRKLCEFWDVFYGEGKRYTDGLEPGTLWEENGALQSILALLGVPREEVDNHHDPVDLKGLCDKHNLLTMEVVNNPKFLELYPFKE
ncbi:MAG: hypothetical protein LBV17_03710 [Treponema sp.]|jgi:hypothetical protein|nr:hypothetical protein [Treponema sp.]